MTKAKRPKGAGEGPPDAGNSGPSGKPRARRRVTIRFPSIIVGFLSLLIWAGIAAGTIVTYYVLDLPTVDQAALTRRPNIKLLDSSGAEIASFGDIYGASIDLKALPPHVPAAVIAVEDRRFYDHPGLDARALLRAGVADIRAGAPVQGGSTITQQVAKNLFLAPDRTLSRKIREALLAIKMERMFTKDEILALYMNRVYFGGGIYGFEAAAERFFNRPAKDLTVFQAAVLAGLLKAPAHYNPVREPDRAKDRARIVLAAMVQTGALTAQQSAAALNGAVGALKAVPQGSTQGRYFADWVLSQVDSFAGPVDRDLIVHTTLDSRLQGQAEAALAKALDESGAKLKVEQGAVVVLGVDGALRAMVGGRDYGASQFNRATNALRQPGSAFKPFVYLAGLEAGYGPEDMVSDAPLRIGNWRPQNFSGTYEGPVTIETAFAKSINTAAVRVAQHAGAKSVVEAAHRLGITKELKPELTLALGSAEVTLLELTAAYAPFANGGHAILPYAVKAITDRAGTPLYVRAGEELGPVMAPADLAVMNRLLAQVIARGTGSAAAFGFPAGGKTGTSSDFRDAWFLGFTADVVAGVWVGNDDGAGMNDVTGGGLPAHIWRDVMVAAHIGKAPRELPGSAPDPEAVPDLIGRFWQALTGK